MNLNIDLKNLPEKLSPLFRLLAKHVNLIVIIVFALIYCFFLVRINSLAASKPSEEAIIEKMEAVKRPRIDEKAADKMLQLEDQNIQIQTLFNEARQNPFAE